MTHLIKKAAADIRSNGFLNLITIMTISLSIIVVSIVLLFFENTGRMMESWNQAGRAMIYLKKKFDPGMLPELKRKINALESIDKIVYISKKQALDKMKEQMSAKTSFLNSLNENPLPDALEIKIKPYKKFEDIQAVAQKIKAIDMVEDIEYGQEWLGKFLKVFNLFKITGYAMCSLFFLIALFITANTVRLAFYSRKIEIEIMRLVGATESFIKMPFYVECLFQGFIGGIIGLLILLVIYLTMLSGIAQNLGSLHFEIKFLSVETIVLIIAGSTFLGWFGCYLSLKQILK